VELINPSGGENQKTYPCFEHQTVADILPPGFTWRYYAPSAGSILQVNCSVAAVPPYQDSRSLRETPLQRFHSINYR